MAAKHKFTVFQCKIQMDNNYYDSAPYLTGGVLICYLLWMQYTSLMKATTYCNSAIIKSYPQVQSALLLITSKLGT